MNGLAYDLALAAALATGVLPVQASMPESTIWLSTCSGGAMPVPTGQDDGRRDCPGACHAACTRSLRVEEDED